MGALMRAKDWSATPLGPVESWPQSLRSALSICLGASFPIAIYWGPRLGLLYNDDWKSIPGSKHPGALGQPAEDVWPEIWPTIGPLFASVMTTGQATRSTDQLLAMHRHGFVEECYFDYTFSPIRSEGGDVGGIFNAVIETTFRVISERRARLLSDLAQRLVDGVHVDEVGAVSLEALKGNPHDICFALLYRADGANASKLTRIGTGIGGEGDAPQTLDLNDEAAIWPFREARSAAAGATVDDLPHKVSTPVVGAAWPEPCEHALVLPLAGGPEAGLASFGFLILGASPRLQFDAQYRAFFERIATTIAAAVARAQAAERDRKRAQELAELDRAKTAFFTNISHEFRTPLALMLGPIEEALKGPALAGEDLELVYRSARRLLRLVNGLLDFARIEAGRLRAQFEPIDLPKLTRDLVSVFRSAAERAGLTLSVSSDAIDAPVSVDVEMFEKIVSNLLSNAIKFTQRGTVSVALRDCGGAVELAVSDTGVGIAESELPRLFERFHRIEDTWSRTQEGSGIGLALLKDLVALHDGSVHAQSTLGRGTTITVSLPKHLGKGSEAKGTGAALRSRLGHSTALAEEATGWSASRADEPQPLPTSLADTDLGEALSSERILIADDNADMLDYLRRLLGSRWQIDTARNGAEALDKIGRSAPDLVVSDVMMPLVDGFALLSAMRENEATRGIPVVLVSARAGEEARIEAIDAGADDYVVKPFSARELVARVEAQLLRQRLRRVEREHGRRLAEVFDQAPVGVALLRGTEHRFEFANPDYVRLVRNRTLIGRTVRDAFEELAGQGIYELLDEVYRSGKPYLGRSVRLVVDEADGTPKERFFDFVYQPTREADGRVNGIAVVVYDVSELTEARRAADAANRAKDEFLAMLGHELRNPLAPIVTGLHVMRIKGDQHLKRERNIIERQVKHLIRLVDDLLDVSRIASGKIEIKKARIDLRVVVETAVETASPALDQHRHTLTLNVSDEPLWIDGDAARLGQVVSNLLVNAAKYTPPGGQIELAAYREGATVSVRVADNGIGISAEMLPLIFDLFIQEKQAIDRAKGGLGLGLTLVRSFVELHGGQVSARSFGQGLGSEFKVALPAADTHPAEDLQAAATERPAQVSHRVLVVDDNLDAAQTLATALELNGIEVFTAADGPQALAVASQVRPEIAVLDIGLPVMDGYALGAALRAEHPQIRLIAVTGYGANANRRRSEEEGFEMHMVKPVDIGSLLDHLGRKTFL